MDEAMQPLRDQRSNLLEGQRNMECQDIIYSNDYASYIMEYFQYTEDIIAAFRPDCLQYINDNYVVIYQRIVGNINLNMGQYGYHTIPKLYAPLATSSMEDTGVLRLRRQPYLNLTGRGVLIGFIDTGIDYQNPIFRYEDGSSRILSIWDQTIPGELEEDAFFDFGTVYRQEIINEALESERPLQMVPSRDTSGHGTFMAGIAAGGDRPSEEFTGAAPDCELLVVKLKQAKPYLKEYYGVSPDAEAYAEEDLMMGFRFLLWEAERVKRPLVVCIGMGSNSGNHDGRVVFSEYLNRLTIRSGTAIVCAAGNEGNRGHHYASQEIGSGEWEDVEFRVGENAYGLSMEVWSKAPNLFSLALTSPLGENTGKIPLWLQNNQTITFPLERTTINVEYTIVERRSGDQVAFIRMRRPTDGIWQIRIFNESGQRAGFHIWLPAEGLVPEGTYFLQPDPDVTICEPGNAAGILTMAAYNHHNDSLYIHSSRGFTSTGVVKPELVAPGVDVYGPALSPGSESRYETRTGSSIAAAHGAGCAALMLEWGNIPGNLTEIQNMQQVKNNLIRGARRMNQVVYPSREWGAGVILVFFFCFMLYILGDSLHN